MPYRAATGFHTCTNACLAASARWLAANAIYRDVVIGVTSPSGKFVAHAWIDGEEDATAGEFVELTRFSP